MRLKEELLFHILCPVEANGVQIHPFKVVKGKLGLYHPSPSSKDLTKLCEAGFVTTTR